MFQQAKLKGTQTPGHEFINNWNKQQVNSLSSMPVAEEEEPDGKTVCENVHVVFRGFSVQAKAALKGLSQLHSQRCLHLPKGLGIICPFAYATDVPCHAIKNDTSPYIVV